MSDPSLQEVVVDRRLLLRQLLQSLKAHGRKIKLPVGCDGYEDWLLDKVDVDLLLTRIAVGTEVDLMAVCRKSSSQGSRSASRRGSLLGRVTPRTPDPLADTAATTPVTEPAVDDMVTRAVELSIQDVTLDLDDGQLKDLAYATFVSVAGHSASAGLLKALRARLGVSEERSAELESVAGLERTKGGEDSIDAQKLGGRNKNHSDSIVSLQTYVSLLERVRPRDFGAFRNFVRWRRGVAATLSSVLRQAVTSRWAGKEGQSARGLLARLAGALRRLDVTDAEEYDEDEYTEASQAAGQAATAVALACANGWSFSWLLRASIADRLLSAAFDPVAEADYVPESEELVRLLKAQVWPALRIGTDTHLALYAWVHYRQFALSQEAKLLDGAAAILKALQAVQHKNGVAAFTIDSSSVPGSPSLSLDRTRTDGAPGTPGARTPTMAAQVNHNDKNKLAEDEDTPSTATGLSIGATRVLECLASATGDLLEDYHGKVGNQPSLARLLALIQVLRRTLGTLDTLPGDLITCVHSSVAAELQRRSRAATASGVSESEAVAALAASALELIRTELRAYSPLLLPIEPTAREEAARAMHDAFGAAFLPWIVRVETLDKSTLKALRIGVALEEFLKAETRVNPPSQPWGLQGRVEPLLLRWASAQTVLLRGWISRIISGEDWRVHGKQPGKGARSTNEALKACAETLEGLFTLGMAPLPVTVVKSLADGVDGALSEYVSYIANSIPSCATIRPPRPALTRYKREDIAAEEQAELMSGDTTRAKEGLGWLPPIGRRDVEGLMAATYEGLVLRASSCLATVDGVAGLERLLLERWSRMEAEGVTRVVEGFDDDEEDVLLALSLDLRRGSARGTDNKADWTSNLFTITRREAERGIESACDAIACRLVHGELRIALYERLYRFHARGSRLEPALQEVDRVLGLCCASAHDGLPSRLARSVYGELLTAYTQVLLDGGPLRLFVPDDVDVLEADLTAMQALFHADADGLSLDEVETAAEHVGAILDAMALETPVLIANYKQALSTPSRPLAVSASWGSNAAPLAAALDPDVLLRVLCHRAEHAASKFLKTLKINKHLPLTVQGQASEAIQKVKSKTPTGSGLLRGFSRASSKTPEHQQTPSSPAESISSRFGSLRR